MAQQWNSKMKMRLTISDENGAELISDMFEIAGRNDYQQAANLLWDRLRETMVKKQGSDPFWNSPFSAKTFPGHDG
jgi:hypothetical protein